MNNKGFTLIELLAVIIILSLLAILASTSVTKVVRDSKSDLYSAQMELIKSAAETWGSDNLGKIPDSGECGYLTIADLKGYGLLDSELKNPKTNKDFSDDIKIKVSSKTTDYGTLKTEYEVDPNSVEGCPAIYGPACIAIDSDGTNLGDKITCGTQSFYVINNNGKKIEMLSEYNINVDLSDPIQSTNAGSITFSDEHYWYDSTAEKVKDDYPYDSAGMRYVFDDNSNLYKYVKAYEIYLKEDVGIESASAKLIDYETLNSIQSNTWVTATTFWTGSAEDSSNIQIYSIYGTGFTFDCVDYNGVDLGVGIRPLVTMPVSELQKT